MSLAKGQVSHVEAGVGGTPLSSHSWHLSPLASPDTLLMSPCQAPAWILALQVLPYSGIYSYYQLILDKLSSRNLPIPPVVRFTHSCILNARRVCSDMPGVVSSTLPQPLLV